MQINASDFERFEINNSLFDLEIDRVPIWERLRTSVFNKIKQQNGTGQRHTGVNNSWRNYIRGGSLFLKNLVVNNPYLANETEILYIGHQRRKKRDDGYWWDIYCDPIHEACDHEYVHFEYPYLMNHSRPARTSNLRYLDLIRYGGTIQRLLGLNEPTIPDEEQTRLEDVQTEIREQFDADIDLVAMAKKELYNRRTTLPLYRQLLNRVDPKLVVIVVSYGRETFIEACKEQNIPVIELQHGVIYERHFGYSYPAQRTKEAFPDYLLTFGDFWKNAIDFPIPNDRVFSVGYPFLEQSAAVYDDVETKNQLLFISQGAIGKQLSKFAVAVNQHPEIDYDIIYKLHPGEYDRWQKEYPWLIGTDIDVIDDTGPTLYQLFSESYGQVGVYSTAVYEGLYFGLETYLYECPGEEILQPLLDNGTAELVSSPEEFVSALESSNESFNQEYYFTPNATERICNVINQLMTNGTSYRNSV